MKRLLLLSLFLPLLAGLARTEEIQPLGRQSTIDQVLDALDARGQTLKDFSATIKLSDVSNDTGLASDKLGEVRFLHADPQQARVLVTLTRKEIEGKPVRFEKIQYLLDPPWLVDRDYGRKVEVRRQVLRAGETINLLKLGEGPFPLPLGQKKEDVHAQFEVKKLDPAADDPSPDAIHLQLSPKKGTQLDRKYQSIDVWVSPASHMPTRIAVVDKAGTTTTTTDLTDLKVNQGLTAADFALPPIEGWERHEEAFQD